MRYLLTAFLCVLLYTPCFALNVSDYRFHTMPETSYYGGIHCITKDSIGRIWFSGYDALFVYNGNTFTQMNDWVTCFLPGSYWSYGQVITDVSGQLYVCTNHGLLRFNYQTKEFELLLEENIGTIAPGEDGTLWLIRNSKLESFHPARPSEITSYSIEPDLVMTELICTREHLYIGSTGKLYRLNKETGEYSLFAVIGDDSHIIRDVIEYNEAVYILTHMDGLFQCDGNGQVVKHYNLSRRYDKSASAKKLYIDASNIIWAATQTGLFLLDPHTEEISLLRFNLHDTQSLPNNSVWYIYPDPDGGVWIGTYGGKLAYMTFFDNNVSYFKATPGGLNHPIVSCFEEDKEGNIWIGTEGGGLNYWNRKTDRFSYYTQGNKTGITSNMIKQLRYDRTQDRLQISAFNGGMEQFDAQQQRFTDLEMLHPVTSQQLSIYDFLPEGDSGIWMTDPDSELMYKDLKKGTVEMVSIFDAKGNRVRMHVETLFHDKDNNLWLVTHGGAYMVDAKTRRILNHYYVENAPYALNNLCSFCITSGSDIWFGTRGGGVNKLSRDGSYVNFGEKEGLLGKTVFGILEDDSTKDIWFSTNDGLYYYEYRNRTITKSAIENLNLCGAFYVRSCYKTTKGEMLFGGTDGFIMFTPGKIKYNTQKPKVFFTGLLINNEPIYPQTKHSPLKKDISTLSYTKDPNNKIILTHKQSNIE
ncbi:MAG: hybrid sensor histidine kinase/response regulator, partial [Tannerellaceae bacterium]|nr:hybrid sensor histidine kinase/response regulator [Tannerellaceae bacterium]